MLMQRPSLKNIKTALHYGMIWPVQWGGCACADSKTRTMTDSHLRQHEAPIWITQLAAFAKEFSNTLSLYFFVDR
jgi:hypothetical protein